MDDDVWDGVVGAAEDALRAASCVPVTVFVVADVVAPDGDRVLVQLASDDARHWQILGMLADAVMTVEGQMREC
jgi:hypothetical protein